MKTTEYIEEIRGLTETKLTVGVRETQRAVGREQMVA